MHPKQSKSCDEILPLSYLSVKPWWGENFRTGNRPLLSQEMFCPALEVLVFRLSLWSEARY